MNNILFNVDGMSIERIYKPKTLTYNRNLVKAQFIFSDEWYGLKTAIFDVDGKAYNVLIDDNNTCTIPEECYTSKNMNFQVGVICGDLETTNWASVPYNESCYTPGATVPNPTPDEYTQIIELINNAGVTDEQLKRLIDEYLTENPVEAPGSSFSMFLFYVDGQQTHWNSEDTSTCYRVENANVWNYVPVKLGDYIAVDNSHDISHYCTFSEDKKGVILDQNIVEKVSHITSVSNFFGKSKNWTNIALRAFSSTDDTTELEKLSDYLYLNDKTTIIFNDDLVASNAQRNKTITGRPLITAIEKTDNSNNVILKDNNIIHLQMLSDNTDDYISDRSYIVVTFYDK